MPEARGAAQKEILQAEAYRDRVIARAEGEARRFESVLAEYNQAKQVMRDRLYIDAMESVLSKSSKVLVDLKEGNNLLYLPLDKLATQREATTTVTSVPDGVIGGAAATTINDDRAATRRSDSR